MSLSQLTEQYNKHRKEMVEKLIEEMKGSFNQFFSEHPEIHGFKWAQYTPWFNDGEPCEFGVEEIGVMKTPEDEEKSHWDLEEEWDHKVHPDVDDFLSVLQGLPSEVFEDAFGDHAEITVTREGITVEEYSHD